MLQITRVYPKTAEETNYGHTNSFNTPTKRSNTLKIILCQEQEVHWLNLGAVLRLFVLRLEDTKGYHVT